MTDLLPDFNSSFLIEHLFDRFDEILAQAASDKESFVVNPEKHFTRSSVLDVFATMEAVYRLHSGSADAAILNMLADQHIRCDVSASAVSQRRDQIWSTLFKYVFCLTLPVFQKAAYSKLVNGYEIVAVDGSGIAIYGNSGSSEQSELFLSKTKNGHEGHYVHANAAFNVSSAMFTDMILQPASCKNEDKALLELVDNDRYRNRNVIVTADRGYESQMTFYRLDKNNIKFVIRSKDKESKLSLTRNYPIPESDAFDIPYSVLLSRQNAWRTHDGIPVKFINKYKDYPEFESQKYLPLNIRMVRLPIQKADGGILWETLMTNLDPKEFTMDDLREIYHMRWDIETGFRDLKCTLGIERLQSRKPDLIVQEIYAAMTIYNLASAVRGILESVKRKQKQCQYRHRINFRFVCKAVMKALFNKAIRSSALWEKCYRKTIPVRPGRPNTR